MDLAYGYFPSPINSDVRASKSVAMETHTIMFQPSSHLSLKPQTPTTPFLVGVHMKSVCSLENIPFSIWAVGSTDPHQSDEINRVSCAINSFNLLSEYSKDELWKNMPKLHRLAQGESSKQRRMSVIDGINLKGSLQSSPSHCRSLGSPQRIFSRPIEPASFALGMEKHDTQEEEIENMERFISKSGRMKMKSGNEQTQSMTALSPTRNRLSIAMNPNHHRDLFALNIPEDLADTVSLQDIDKDASQRLKSISPSLCTSKSLRLFDMDFEAGIKYGISPSLPTCSHNKLAFQPEKYINTPSSTLPMLTPPTKEGRQKPTGEEKKIEFPFLVQSNPDVSLQPKRKWRKFPDPKPIKYTMSK
jgi:hypothetical protein